MGVEQDIKAAETDLRKVVPDAVADVKAEEKKVIGQFEKDVEAVEAFVEGGVKAVENLVKKVFVGAEAVAADVKKVEAKVETDVKAAETTASETVTTVEADVKKV